MTNPRHHEPAPFADGLAEALTMRTRLTLIVLATLSAGVLAETPPPPPELTVDEDESAAVMAPDAPPAPAPAPLAEEEAELQPEVVIRKRGRNTVEEYRINGRLYKVRVTPPGGGTYFLIDTDGDGLMDTRRNDLNAKMVVPQWVLFRW